MKKNDRLLAAGILLAVCLSGILLYGNRAAGNYVLIQVDGAEYGRYSLEEDQVVEINGTNRLEIQGGEAFMTWGDCPDQICVHTEPVSSVHEVIGSTGREIMHGQSNIWLHSVPGHDMIEKVTG